MPIKKETFFVFDMDGVILDSLDNLSSCLIKAVEPFCQSDEHYQSFSKFDTSIKIVVTPNQKKIARNVKINIQLFEVSVRKS